MERIQTSSVNVHFLRQLFSLCWMENGKIKKRMNGKRKVKKILIKNFYHQNRETYWCVQVFRVRLTSKIDWFCTQRIVKIIKKKWLKDCETSRRNIFNCVYCWTESFGNKKKKCLELPEYDDFKLSREVFFNDVIWIVRKFNQTTIKNIVTSFKITPKVFYQSFRRWKLSVVLNQFLNDLS